MTDRRWHKEPARIVEDHGRDQLFLIKGIGLAGCQRSIGIRKLKPFQVHPFQMTDKGKAVSLIADGHVGRPLIDGCLANPVQAHQVVFDLAGLFKGKPFPK